MVPELVKKAHSIAFRVTKAEALDLPDTIDEIRPVTLEDKGTKTVQGICEGKLYGAFKG